MELAPTISFEMVFLKHEQSFIEKEQVYIRYKILQIDLILQTLNLTPYFVIQKMCQIKLIKLN